MAGISPWQLLIVLLIVLLIFGTKKLRNVGGDLGSAIKDFRKGLNESEDKNNDGDDSSESSKPQESSEPTETPRSPEPGIDERKS